MTTADWDSSEIDEEKIEVITSFTFLGSVIENEGKCDMEIKRRVAIGKAALTPWDGKDMEGQTCQHRHQKKASEGNDLSYSIIWLRDMDNDKELGEKD